MTGRRRRRRVPVRINVYEQAVVQYDPTMQTLLFVLGLILFLLGLITGVAIPAVKIREWDLPVTSKA
jgi:hypothetical protein